MEATAPRAKASATARAHELVGPHLDENVSLSVPDTWRLAIRLKTFECSESFLRGSVKDISVSRSALLCLAFHSYLPQCNPARSG
jgi:hypothetical protein